MDSKAFKENTVSTVVLFIGLLGFGAAIYSVYHWLLKFNTFYSALSTVATIAAVILVFFRLLFTS
jgi:hypothetical protein